MKSLIWNYPIHHGGDPLFGGIEDSAAFHGWWVIFWFILFSTIVIFSCLKIAKYLDHFAKHTKLSSTFLGGIMMTFATSMPEIITSIYAGITEDPKLGYYHYIGANSITTFALMAASLILTIPLVARRKRVGFQFANFSEVDRSTKLLFGGIVLINFVFFLTFFIPGFNSKMYIPGLRISFVSLLSILMLVFFIGWSIYTSKFSRNKHESGHGHTKNSHVHSHSFNATEFDLSKPHIHKWIWLKFSLATLAVIVVSYFNNITVTAIQEVFELEQSSAVQVFLVFANEMPEIISVIALLYLGRNAIAVSGIAGCHFLNGGLMGITDLINTSGSKGSFYEITESTSSTVESGVLSIETIKVLVLSILLVSIMVKPIYKYKQLYMPVASIASILYVTLLFIPLMNINWIAY